MHYQTQLILKDKFTHQRCPRLSLFFFLMINWSCTGKFDSNTIDHTFIVCPALSSMCGNINVSVIHVSTRLLTKSFWVFTSYSCIKTNSSSQQHRGTGCSGLLASPHYVVIPQCSRRIMAAHTVRIGRCTTQWASEDEDRAELSCKLKITTYNERIRQSAPLVPYAHSLGKRVKHKSVGQWVKEQEVQTRGGTINACNMNTSINVCLTSVVFSCIF